MGWFLSWSTLSALEPILFSQGPLKDLAERLIGEHLVICLSKRVDCDDLADTLADLSAGSIHFCPIGLAPGPGTLIDRAWRSMGELAGAPEMVRDLVAEAGNFLGPTVLIPGSREAAEAFRGMLEEWSDIEKRKGQKPSGLSLFWQFEQRPKTSLRVYWHWDVASCALARLIAGRFHAIGSSRSAWFTELIAAFGAWDLSLASYLTENWSSGEVDDLLELVKAFGQENGLERNGGIKRIPRLRDATVADGIFEDWWAGRLVQSVDCGLGWHPCLFEAVDPELDQLVWSGQVGLALPMADRIRVFGIRYLNKQHGLVWTTWVRQLLPTTFSNWAETKWARLRLDPFSAELAWVDHVTEGGGGSPAIRSGRLKAAVEDAHAARKLLAHSQSVSFGLFCRLASGLEDSLRLEADGELGR